MNHRVFAVAALAAVATVATPVRAHAAAPPMDCTLGIGSVQLGFGGFFSNCWAGFQVSRYFENAEDVSNMYWFNGMPTRDLAGTNDPLSAPGTLLFNNDCGSNGNPALPGAFCVPQQSQVIVWGNTTELVFGLEKAPLNGSWWLYTGDDASRNDPAPPGGIQNYLWQITGGQYDGQYLLGWEDLNSGCLSADSSTGNDEVTDPGTVNGDNLDELLASCNTRYSRPATEESDDDYNDFYAIINPLDDSELTALDVVPEPASMMMLATGLLGLGGASFRRRRR